MVSAPWWDGWQGALNHRRHGDAEVGLAEYAIYELLKLIHRLVFGVAWLLLALVLAGWFSSGRTLILVDVRFIEDWGLAIGSCDGQLAIRIGEIGPATSTPIELVTGIDVIDRDSRDRNFDLEIGGAFGAQQKIIHTERVDGSTGRVIVQPFVFVPGGRQRSAMLEMPYLVWYLLAVIVPAYALLSRWGRVLLPGYCKQCHYNMRGLSADKPCPECGYTPDA
jgi:hypothetical protein